KRLTRESGYLLSINILTDLAEEKMLIFLLSQLTNTDAAFEEPLRRIRFSLLTHYANRAPASDNLIKLASAVAIQAFHTQHVIALSKEERIQHQSVSFSEEVADLRDAERPGRDLEWCIAITGMYEALAGSKNEEWLMSLDQKNFSPLFATMIRKALKEPAEERKIRNEIPELQPITDPTSTEVRAQYEEHSYPRWFYLAPARQTSYRDFLSAQFPHTQFDQKLLEPVSVLAAGCGTGQEAAMIARNRLINEVVGLDLSKSSLAYAERMREQLKLDNVRFIQGDILDSYRLGHQFQIIESTGVLHHMHEPELGWQALLNCLNPAGLMKVGLYSERASSDINAARQWIHENGYDSKSETIRAVREKILKFDKSHPLYSLRHSEDFYSISACRDLIFHVHEQCYTPEQLREMLIRLRLEFIGFELSEIQTKQKYLKMYPHDLAMTDLTNWEEFDRQFPATFSGMLVFWCRKLPD
ncbi:MAG: class I SAM-dependent methyltransferase, partial [bacterium]